MVFCVWCGLSWEYNSWLFLPRFLVLNKSSTAITTQRSNFTIISRFGRFEPLCWSELKKQKHETKTSADRMNRNESLSSACYLKYSCRWTPIALHFIQTTHKPVWAEQPISLTKTFKQTNAACKLHHAGVQTCEGKCGFRCVCHIRECDQQEKTFG